MANALATACRNRRRRMARRSQPCPDPVGRAGPDGRALAGSWGSPPTPPSSPRRSARDPATRTQVQDLALRGTAVGETVRLLTAWDVRAACDVLRPTADRTGGRDGRVSIEVDPRIAQDAARTAAEARGLWWLVDRPNLFIKIPATLAGLPAITETLAAGISVNVTLIFSVERYRAVLDAFLAGLEQTGCRTADR